MLTVSLAVLAVVLTCLLSFLVVPTSWSRRRKLDLGKLPGPNRSQVDRLTKKDSAPLKRHLVLAALKKQYGPIFEVSQKVTPVVCITDFDSIYKVLVTEGKLFGGRERCYRNDNAFGGTGILFSRHADTTWRTLRKVAHQHLRQFSDGLSRLEGIITEVAEDMFAELQASEGTPYDPAQVVLETALNSIAFLITGERPHTGDRIVRLMAQYEDMVLATRSYAVPKYFEILNTVPWLAWLGLDRWEPYQRLLRLQDDIWAEVGALNRANPDSESIYKVFQRHLKAGGENGTGRRLTETDAKMTSLMLLFAGVTTTSATFTSLINLLAHNTAVQERLYEELEALSHECGTRHVTLKERWRLPYANAVLMETLRYTSVVPHGVPHQTTADAEISGYRIPKDTEILVSLWNLHHDEEFWPQPNEFRPERFLDAAGALVTADHPNRTHLMPFGAGTRVCVAETLATARLFLWLTTLAGRYQLTPAPDNPRSLTEPQSYIDRGVMKSPPFKVIFQPRD